ncbi:nuclear transport factor 2 family protein [Klebsiella sp. BIGb0407]|uniref:nuclear transport factor 2 family protein n=1 Tax=Klebsiella sp. BIGb0407 TaxID=2940603 RepID=UPI002166E64A|nr:nuclear transport factor 2 family protein [Klebsiella sp. BIGb0407]MCS3429922.1 hypothetical protein [Klebsiella sp. BIGb0407]
MANLSALLSVIRDLEIQLHQPALRLDAERVEKLLHSDFEEIGRSGQFYNRSQTIAALKMENDHPQIFSADFTLKLICTDVALLRYKSFQLNGDGEIIRRTERSSIWLLSSTGKNDSQWQMRFHQGTAIGD